MKKSIEVTNATALMMEALQKKYEAICLAVEAIEDFCGVSDSKLKEREKDGWKGKDMDTYKRIYDDQAEKLCERVYEAAWGFEDALWGIFCEMARDNALNEVEAGKIFNRI